MTWSEKEKIRKFRFFAVWREGKEAHWLQSMSAKGWHLKHVSFLSYVFEKGNPEDYTYALDFRIEVSTDMQEYLALIEDSGWQHIGCMGGWQYFRIATDMADGARIYSDVESLLGKYWRVLGVLCLSSLPLFTLFLTGSLNRPGLTETPLIYLIYTIATLLGYSILRMLVLILRKRNQITWSRTP